MCAFFTWFFILHFKQKRTWEDRGLGDKGTGHWGGMGHIGHKGERGQRRDTQVWECMEEGDM